MDDNSPSSKNVSMPNEIESNGIPVPCLSSVNTEATPNPNTWDTNHHLKVTSIRSGGIFINEPTFIQKDFLKFLIMDAPHYDNVTSYVQQLLKYNTSDLVRTCERTYDESIMEDAGIITHALAFPDGEPPSETIIAAWMDIISEAVKKNSTVAVHCIAGLGRAPVLVVIALIENGMKNIDAIEFVRSQRRGAINKRQLQYLMNYKNHNRKTNRYKWCCSIKRLKKKN